MDEILQRLADFFSADRLGAYLVNELMPDLAMATIALLAFWLLWRVLRTAVGAVLRRAGVDATAQDFVQALLKYVLLTIGVVTALGQMGVNTASLLTSLGVAGLTIGFAARDALSNIISGLFIFWDRPFVVGDFVEIGGDYGKVQEITMRSTRVVTVDGKMLAIPNTQIVNSTVASYTNFPHLRLDVDATVGTGEDLGKVRRALLAVVEGDSRFLDEPKPQVVVTALNDYNVAVQLRAWLDDERSHVPVRLELREKIFEALRDEGVEMPFETFALSPVVLAGEAAPIEGRA